MSSAPAQEAVHAELRAAVGKGFPVPPSLEHIPERPYNLKSLFKEEPLNEYRVVPAVTGVYGDIAAEACRRNDQFMPYTSVNDQPDPDASVVIPISYYPHPVSHRRH